MHPNTSNYTKQHVVPYTRRGYKGWIQARMGAIAPPLIHFSSKKLKINKLKLEKETLKIKWVKSDEFL